MNHQAAQLVIQGIALMANQHFVRRHGKVLGPMSVAALQPNAAKGQLRPTDEVTDSLLTSKLLSVISTNTLPPKPKFGQRCTPCRSSVRTAYLALTAHSSKAPLVFSPHPALLPKLRASSGLIVPILLTVSHTTFRKHS